MKAIILAAGQGSRLKEVEPDVPKCMVRIGGKPVLERTIEWMNQLGINDIIVTVNKNNSDYISNYFGSSIRYAVEETPKGTAGGVINVWRGAVLSEPIIVWHGDNVSNCNLIRMIEFHNRTRADGTIAVCWRADAQPSSIVEWNQNTEIIYFHEKPT